MAVKAKVLAATIMPLAPMLVPPAAMACQLWAEVPGTHVAVERLADGTSHVMSPVSAEA